ncbi:hypothetical protein, partial [uncultured Rubinisphaera sp.]|uniref:hypothetical protein n=1 Tax=uncultured Rubinisphaera sp. TaxID=1678686 RepID=UPI0030D6F894
MNVLLAVENEAVTGCVILTGNSIAQAGWGDVHSGCLRWRLFNRKVCPRDAKFPFVIAVSPLVGC